MFDKTVKAGIFPIRSIPNQPLFDRIPMDIIKMGVMIRIVPDKMIPKPPLPEPALAVFHAAFGYSLAFCYGSGEIAFNQAPAHRKTLIARWQRPDAMQMIRQNHNGFYPKRVFMPDSDESLAQCANVIHQQPIAFALGEIDGEKPCRARSVNTPVFCHGGWSPLN